MKAIDQEVNGVLLDADALVALAKTDDSNHQSALKIDQYLQNVNVQYYLSPFTIPEVVTVLSYKVSHRSAVRFLQEIRKFKLPILEVQETELSSVDDIFTGQNKKGTSYFDCYNIFLMRNMPHIIQLLFSFDGIYAKAGLPTVHNLFPK